MLVTADACDVAIVACGATFSDDEVFPETLLQVFTDDGRRRKRRRSSRIFVPSQTYETSAKIGHQVKVPALVVVLFGETFCQDSLDGRDFLLLQRSFGKLATDLLRGFLVASSLDNFEPKSEDDSTGQTTAESDQTISTFLFVVPEMEIMKN